MSDENKKLLAESSLDANHIEILNVDHPQSKNNGRFSCIEVARLIISIILLLCAAILCFWTWYLLGKVLWMYTKGDQEGVEDYVGWLFWPVVIITLSVAFIYALDKGIEAKRDRFFQFWYWFGACLIGIGLVDLAVELAWVLVNTIWTGSTSLTGILAAPDGKGILSNVTSTNNSRMS